MLTITIIIIWFLEYVIAVVFFLPYLDEFSSCYEPVALPIPAEGGQRAGASQTSCFHPPIVQTLKTWIFEKDIDLEKTKRKIIRKAQAK